MREARRLRDAYRALRPHEDEAKQRGSCRAVWMMTPLRFWMAQETAESSRLMLLRIYRSLRSEPTERCGTVRAASDVCLSV
jgi:hypothetical protein